MENEKTPLQLAQEAFAEWLHLIDGMLEDAELSFEEFVGHGQRRELQEAGEALARAEDWVHRAREVLRVELEEEEDADDE
jgi:cell division septum initiation protein DivIVA